MKKGENIMFYVFVVSKLAVIFNCLAFIMYYLLQLTLIVTSIYTNPTELYLLLHEVPFVSYAQQIEAGISLTFPGATNLFHLFIIPIIVIIALVSLNIIFIVWVNNLVEKTYSSYSLSFIFFVFIMIFFFDKRALLGLIGIIGLIFVAKVREQDMRTASEYSFLIGRLTFLVATAFIWGDYSYQVVYEYMKTSSGTLFAQHTFDYTAAQVVPNTIETTVTYLLGTAVFFMCLFLTWTVIRYTRRRHVNKLFICGVLIIGVLVIFDKPIFGTFFLGSGIAFLLSLNSDVLREPYSILKIFFLQKKLDSDK